MKKKQWLTWLFLVLLAIGLMACADSTDPEDDGDDLPAIQSTQPVNGDGRGNSPTPAVEGGSGTELPSDDNSDGADDDSDDNDGEADDDDGNDDDDDDDVQATPAG